MPADPSNANPCLEPGTTPVAHDEEIEEYVNEHRTLERVVGG